MTQIESDHLKPRTTGNDNTRSRDQLDSRNTRETLAGITGRFESFLMNLNLGDYRTRCPAATLPLCGAKTKKP